MKSQNRFDKFFTAWDADGIGYFKVAQVFFSETKDAKNLEVFAKRAARDIAAEVFYAWNLDKPKSDAWWLGWGGYDLEEDIPFFAAMARPEVAEKLAAFDPRDNEFECATLEEYKEMLFNAYDEELTAADLRRGFHDWVRSLNKTAQETLLKDLQSWQNNAENP